MVVIFITIFSFVEKKSFLLNIFRNSICSISKTILLKGLDLVTYTNENGVVHLNLVVDGKLLKTV